MTKDSYSFGAKIYDSWIEPANRAIRLIGMKMAPGSPGMRVLDVGCGTGTHLALYQRQGCEIVGVEPSSAMFARARAKLGSGVELHAGDGADMPFESNMFDLTLLSLVLHETAPEKREGILGESIRVTKPTGALLIIDYHPVRKKNWSGFWKKGVILFVERMAGGAHFRNYRHFICHRGIFPLTKRFGLAVEQQKLVAGENVGVFLFRLKK